MTLDEFRKNLRGCKPQAEIEFHIRNESKTSILKVDDVFVVEENLTDDSKHALATIVVVLYPQS